jgi:hypothetical protein
VLEVGTDKSKQRLVYHRLLCGFALIDLFVSSGRFLTTWPVPKPSENVVFAIGNEQTCDFQGFLIQMSSALPIYSAMITIYFLLAIRYNLSEEKIKKNFELALHTIPIAFALATSSAALSFKMFNEAELWCWIASFPSGCGKSRENEIELVTCIRGEAFQTWRRYMVFLPLWFMFGIMLCCQFMVWQAVKLQENRNARYSPAINVTQQSLKNQEEHPSLCQKIYHSMSRVTTKTKNSRSQQVFSQSLFYVTMFYVIHLIPGIDRIHEEITGTKNYGLLLAHAIIIPLQGFSNFIVYRRPQYVRLRNQYPDESFYLLLIKALEMKSCRIRCRNPGALSIPNFGQVFDLSRILEDIKNSTAVSDHDRHFASLQAILGFPNQPQSSDNQPQNLDVREEQASD